MKSYDDLFTKLECELERDKTLRSDMVAVADIRLEHQAIVELRQAVSDVVDYEPVVYTVA